ncbi:SDR family NAD(P)-dependent oxidoreductase [Nocardia amamiensis]|uniref:SDR family NAD(P)-dependent oxidoreductase n=1 Tax=Nocardia amamiensis TaxID=404578 RepID=A0ABS0CRN1_9NOCA|nr:SDR family NAD(P)-dependent oxidoreductase [Nocardia amamiensis]MBF6297539.1 SDR family NAD(P)-dependent oxidoreductase [Nocardia amamiensis]
MTDAETADLRAQVRHRRRDRDLTGRHVLITGASSGIGRAAAMAVAGKGATVFLLARRGDELAAVVDEIKAAGGSAYGYACDVTDSDSVDQVVETVLDEHGHVDMLVNNAGRSIRRAIHRSTDRLHDFERTMAVNYFGALRLTLALLPQMRERKFGHIVNISSAGVQVATPRFSAYLASKAALDKFTEVAAVETMADGVTFTTIHMPLVRTPMIAPSGDQGPAESPEWAAATIVRALTERPKRIDVPLGTIAEYGALLTPKLRDRILHRYYRALPDSPAAKGQQEGPEEQQDEPAPLPAPRAQSAARRVTGTALRRAARWVPGTHW